MDAWPAEQRRDDRKPGHSSLRTGKSCWFK